MADLVPGRMTILHWRHFNLAHIPAQDKTRYHRRQYDRHDHSPRLFMSHYILSYIYRTATSLLSALRQNIKQHSTIYRRPYKQGWHHNNLFLFVIHYSFSSF